MSDLSFTHLDPMGRARMVDVTPKEPTHRRAVARCVVTMQSETTAAIAPTIVGAELVTSEANRHEYIFDAGQFRIPDLLAQASTQTEILDVETHRVPIDDVIADIYEAWQAKREVGPA